MDTGAPIKFAHSGFQKGIDEISKRATDRFKHLIRSYMLFHLLVIGLIVLECIALFFLLSLYPKTTALALNLSAMILTSFTYLVLFFYFQARKPEQFAALEEVFIEECKKILPENIPTSDYHLSLANSAHKLAMMIGDWEKLTIALPASFLSINRIMKKVSLHAHMKDVKAMKELLFQGAIAQHLALIRIMPTDLEVHASLAHSYMGLAKIYDGEEYIKTMRKAIEEFRIIDHYAKDNPWVQTQLARCYQAVGEEEKELLVYEKIHALCPQDKEVMHQLGSLYFRTGSNAKGLQIYEKLAGLGYPSAQELLNEYETV